MTTWKRSEWNGGIIQTKWKKDAVERLQQYLGVITLENCAEEENCGYGYGGKCCRGTYYTGSGHSNFQDMRWKHIGVIRKDTGIIPYFEYEKMSDYRYTFFEPEMGKEVEEIIGKRFELAYKINEVNDWLTERPELYHTYVSGVHAFVLSEEAKAYRREREEKLPQKSLLAREFGELEIALSDRLTVVDTNINARYKSLEEPLIAEERRDYYSDREWMALNHRICTHVLHENILPEFREEMTAQLEYLKSRFQEMDVQCKKFAERL